MKQISNYFSHMSETLKELLLGIGAWGVLLELLFLLCRQSGAFLVSLAVGVLSAACFALHMNYFVESAVELGQEYAGKRMVKGAVIRMGMTVLLIMAVFWLKGNVLALFFGLLTLKLGAYTQPLMHKIIQRKTRKEEGR